MNNVFDILKNYTLVSAVSGWCFAQFAKAFTGMFREEKFSLGRLLFATGGMPSSHSAMVSALCAASGAEYGLSSFQFSVTFALAMIVMRDAVGVRKEVGEQAKAINQLRENLFSWPIDDATLQEFVGHTPLQVLIGSIVGISAAFFVRLIYPV